MTSFDRALIYTFGYIGFLMLQAGEDTDRIHFIYMTVIYAVLIISENRVSVHREKAEYYKRLFLDQNRKCMKYVNQLGGSNNDRRTRIFRIFRVAGQKSGIDKSKSA
ncbi:MAG: hypothetical protein IKP95_09285 [Ruminococcus sp.]|nr:hypothetical protein [Ruminococcus sp.]